MIFYFAVLESPTPIHSVVTVAPRFEARSKRRIRRKQKDWLAWSCCKAVVNAFLVTEAQAGSLWGCFYKRCFHHPAKDHSAMS